MRSTILTACALLAASAIAGAQAYNFGDVMTWRGPGTKPAFMTMNSTYIIEGTNLFYTNARSRSTLSAVFPIAYNSATGVISFSGLSGAGLANKIIGINPSGNAAIGKVFIGIGGAAISTNAAGDTVFVNAGVGGGGTGIQAFQNTDGIFTVTNPNGPTTTLNFHQGTLDSNAFKPLSIAGSDITDSTITSRKLNRGANIGHADTAKYAISANPGGAAGGSLSGTYPNPGIAAGTVDSNAIKNGSVATNDAAPDFKAPRATLADSANAAKPTGAAGGSLSGSYPNPAVAANAITAAMIADQQVTTAKFALSAKAPFAVLADSAKAAPLTGPAGGDLTGNYPSPAVGQNKIGTGNVIDGTLQRADVASNFKAPFADTADATRDFVAATATISALTDSAWFPVAGFDSTQGWVGGWAYTDNQNVQPYNGTPDFVKHMGGIGIRSNYDWVVNVEISFLYKLRK